MTLIEVTVALVIFGVAAGMLLHVLTNSQMLRRLNREQQIAASAAQNMMEEIRNTPFRDIVRQHDRDPFNDLDGPGTAQGWSFQVDGLDAMVGSEGGVAGEIVLPLINIGTDILPVWQVREDIGDERLGLPRDLNGDILVDSNDHSDDYSILPVVVIVRWNGYKGERTLRLFSSLTQIMEEAP